MAAMAKGNDVVLLCLIEAIWKDDPENEGARTTEIDTSAVVDGKFICGG
jgi:hypothetical protein